MNAIQPDISIIIPTFNPEERILSRVLTAVEAFECDDGLQIECVIVDNKSRPSISELRSIKGFLDRNAWMRVIEESRQGLTFSRLAGFKVTTGSIIAVFDDDNEPDKNYLKTARTCFEKWPSVGIWGPGNIAVEFLDPVPKWFARQFRGYFSEKHQEHPEFGCVRAAWTHFYPIGMGQVLRRDVADRYTEAVEGELVSATDRKGNSLASGGDVQLVWEAIKMGFAAGVHPELRLAHLIPAKRCTVGYVKRLVFGCGSSYPPALIQSFPAEKSNVARSIPSNWQIGRKLLRLTIHNLVRLRGRRLPVEWAHFLGEIVGRLRSVEAEPRRGVFGLVKLLNLE